MPKRSRSRQGKKLDLSELAASITEEATNETPPLEAKPEDEGKNPAAVALGRLGGLKGGKARAAKLTYSNLATVRMTGVRVFAEDPLVRRPQEAYAQGVLRSHQQNAPAFDL